MAYARLSSLYGPPVSSYNRGGDLSATWWGPGGRYVTLRFDYRAPCAAPTATTPPSPSVSDPINFHNLIPHSDPP